MGSKYLTAWFEVESLVHTEWCNKVLFLVLFQSTHFNLLPLATRIREEKEMNCWTLQIIFVICIFLAVRSKWLCGILSWKKINLNILFLVYG